MVVNNIEFIENFCIRSLMKYDDPSLNEDLIGEFKVSGHFLKDAIKAIMKIKFLKDDEEIIIDLIDIGFMSILKEDGEYIMTVVLNNEKTRTKKVSKASEAIVWVTKVIKDQLTIARRNLKNKE